MDRASAGPLDCRLELREQSRDLGRPLGELGPGGLRRIPGGVQRQPNRRQIRRAFQLGLAAYGDQRSRSDRFCHGKTICRP